LQPASRESRSREGRAAPKRKAASGAKTANRKRRLTSAQGGNGDAPKEPVLAQIWVPNVMHIQQKNSLCFRYLFAVPCSGF